MMGWTKLTSEAGEPFSVRGRIWLLVTVNKWDSTLSIGSVALGTPWVKYLRSLLLEEKQTWICWEVKCVLCQEMVIWLQTSGEISFSLYPVYLSLYKVFEVKFCSQVSSQELWGPKSLSSQLAVRLFWEIAPPAHFYCTWVNSVFFSAEGKRLKDSFCVASKL